MKGKLKYIKQATYSFNENANMHARERERDRKSYCLQQATHSSPPQ